jgi:hypothetical protein
LTLPNGFSKNTYESDVAFLTEIIVVGGKVQTEDLRRLTVILASAIGAVNISEDGLRRLLRWKDGFGGSE